MGQVLGQSSEDSYKPRKVRSRPRQELLDWVMGWGVTWTSSLLLSSSHQPPFHGLLKVCALGMEDVGLEINLLPPSPRNFSLRK